MDYVIEPLDKNQILQIFDKKAIAIIEYYLKLSSFAQPESKLNQDDIGFQTIKEHMEQWVVQAIGAEPMGAGSYPVDLKTDTFLADIKSMSIKVNSKGIMSNAESGEASLGQKFSETDLDKYFENKEWEKIKDLWVTILTEKYETVTQETGISDIYYIFFMRSERDYYLFATKLNYEKISENAEVDFERSTEDSVFLKNFIDPDQGSVKIYKAKKRMELRLRPKYFIDNGLCYKFETLQHPEKKNLRDTDLEKHLSEKIENFLK